MYIKELLQILFVLDLISKLKKYQQKNKKGIKFIGNLDKKT